MVDLVHYWNSQSPHLQTQIKLFAIEFKCWCAPHGGELEPSIHKNWKAHTPQPILRFHRFLDVKVILMKTAGQHKIGAQSKQSQNKITIMLILYTLPTLSSSPGAWYLGSSAYLDAGYLLAMLCMGWKPGQLPAMRQIPAWQQPRDHHCKMHQERERQNYQDQIPEKIP